MPTDPVDLSGAKVLIVDDTPGNLDVLAQILESAGYDISVASGGEVALRLARSAPPDLILLDVQMPGMDGYETCRRLKAEASTRDVPVVFITASRGEVEGVVEGFQAGGVDYVVKPVQKEELLIRVRTHLERARLAQELARRNEALEQRNRDLARANEALRAETARRQTAEEGRQRADEHLDLISQQEARRWGIEGFVGQSRTVQKIIEEVRQLQGAGATGVLVCGESGTGKELIARALHYGGPRARGPFIPVNCAAIPRDLAESSLFGHVRGAFTGATSDRKGYFEQADGGTLFLDEVGDMPPELQAKLLRVLEEGRITPVGGAQERRVDVRVVAATNADLSAGLARGAFRQDLYFRLARFTVQVPPLRERKEDIPLLAEHFMDLFASEMGRVPPALSPEALESLTTYDFPGNVRELKNLMERALLESGGTEVRPDHLHFLRPSPASSSSSSQDAAPASPQGLDWPDFERAELERIKQALIETRGNIVAAARLLGTNRMRIYRLMRKHNLMQ